MATSRRPAWRDVAGCVELGSGQSGEDGSPPSGRETARQYGRHERCGRLVARIGTGSAIAVNSVGQMSARPFGPVTSAEE